MKGLACAHVPSALGDVGILWQEEGASPRVRRILLPSEQMPAVAWVALSDAGLPSVIARLGERMRRFLAGEEVEFEPGHLDLLMLATCSEFQRKVLLAEYGIPRGSVSTYGRIAKHLGVPRGARAVGNALAHNPFPIVIPCHRAVRADGTLGGFRGGLKMKRALLEMEGVEISPAGKVLADRFYYSDDT